MRSFQRLAPLVLLLAVVLVATRGEARSTAAPAADIEYRVVVGRLDGILDVDDLDDADLKLVRSIVDSTAGDPLPHAKELTAALAKAFGSADLEPGDVIYVWEIDPRTGEWIKVCIELDRIVVAPEVDSNPIIVRLTTRVFLD